MGQVLLPHLTLLKSEQGGDPRSPFVDKWVVYKSLVCLCGYLKGGCYS